QAARLACQRALGLEPDAFRGHILMARIALASSNLMLAQAHLQRAVALRPSSPDLRARLAEVMTQRSQFKAALEMAASARALNGDHFGAGVVITRCHIALGRLATAQNLLDQLEQQRPNGPGLAKVRTLLALRQRSASAVAAPAASPQDVASSASEDVEHDVAPPAASSQWVSAPSSDAGLAAPLVDTAAAPKGEASTREGPVEAVWSAAPRRRGVLDDIAIIHALILRSLKVKHRGNPFGVAVELLRPIAVIVGHYYLFWVLHRPMPGNAPIIVFVVGGFTVWFAFSTTEMGAANASKHSGGIIALNGVTDIHLRCAGAVWPILFNLTFCLLAMIPLKMYGAELPIPNLVLTFGVFAIAGSLGFGFGLLFERLGSAWPAVKVVEKLLSWILYISAGMYFCVATVHPPVIADIMLYNPLVHLVEYERHAFVSGYPVSLVNLTYPLCSAVVLCFFGLLAHKWLPASA
ncbi:MAG: tetratricopeptide repeat protein, partial [Hyphomicrobiales bacterium]|nr:tetratricopeptide repeat protein [Hyphomicrobiales bacterium]